MNHPTPWGPWLRFESLPWLCQSPGTGLHQLIPLLLIRLINSAETYQRRYNKECAPNPPSQGKSSTKNPPFKLQERLMFLDMAHPHHPHPAQPALPLYLSLY